MASDPEEAIGLQTISTERVIPTAADKQKPDCSTPGKPFNHNQYATTKTFIQGCLDFVVFKQNLSDFMLFTNNGHEHYKDPFVFLLITSLALHVVAWVYLLRLGKMDLCREEDGSMTRAKHLNFRVNVILFTITVLNIVLEFKVQPGGAGVVKPKDGNNCTCKGTFVDFVSPALNE